MLDTFKVRLKAKSTAAGANLSAERIDAMAAILNQQNPDISEEADHDKAIDAATAIQSFKDIAAFDDYQRAKAAKEKKEKTVEPTKEKQTPTDEPPAWFKAYAEKVDRLEQEKTLSSIKQKLTTHEKLKGIKPAFYEEWQLPQSEDEIESFADKVAQKHSAFIQDEANEKLSQVKTPLGGTRSDTKSVDAQIEAWAKSKAPEPVKEK